MDDEHGRGRQGAASMGWIGLARDLVVERSSASDPQACKKKIP